MAQSTIMKLIPAIGAFREMAVKSQKDSGAKEDVKEHAIEDTSDLEKLDFAETK